ncbi:DJ-1/PfpI family protein [Natronogracilivirga saccharolytica]|nr:DJ-1/PfpI family protein [Natronogracilivirga saccharolytica]
MQVAIVVYPGMTALDAIGPYEVFRFIPNCDLRFVYHQTGPVVTDSRVLILGATHSFEETPEPDIILVPGSEANTVTAMADSDLIKWLRRVHQTTRLTLSVCTGSMILAAAGILQGHPATTHWIAQKRLAAFGVQPQPDKRVVSSGKIKTAAGVSAGIDLSLQVVSELYGRQMAEKIQLIIEYDPKPPFQSGHPNKASKEVLTNAETEMKKRSYNSRNFISVPKIYWNSIINKVRMGKED